MLPKSENKKAQRRSGREKPTQSIFKTDDW
jgi:hypothetical protein